VLINAMCELVRGEVRESPPNWCVSAARPSQGASICGASPPEGQASPVPDSEPERLSDQQYVVLLLRLLIDAEGHIATAMPGA
jgi:hypothetical protein